MLKGFWIRLRLTEDCKLCISLPVIASFLAMTGRENPCKTKKLKVNALASNFQLFM